MGMLLIDKMVEFNSDDVLTLPTISSSFNLILVAEDLPDFDAEENEYINLDETKNFYIFPQDGNLVQDFDTMSNRSSVIKFNFNNEEKEQFINQIIQIADKLDIRYEDLDMSWIVDPPNYNINKDIFKKITKDHAEQFYEEYIKEKEKANRISTDENMDIDINERKPEVIIKKRPGRPRTSNKPRVKSDKKTGKVWEFIYNLLESQEHNDKIIWDNKSEGVFKFVSSDGVAKLWGQQRSKPKMNFEKFSRAMRYYYQSGILEPVLNQRLKYKFGPNSKVLKKYS